MTKIIALGASNSKASINKTFATYVASKVSGAQVEVLDLNDYELPLFHPDLANEVPANAQKFYDKITSANGFIISLAEYNGTYTPAFKNLWDWTSKINQKLWGNKPMLLLATSPGPRGAMGVLKTSTELFPHYGGTIVADFSLPSFGNNFSPDGLTDETLNAELNTCIKTFEEALN